MHIKPIRNDDDLTQAFKRLESVFQAEAGTAEFDEVDVLVTLIKAYESKYFPIQHAEPAAGILFQMEELSLI